VATANDIKWNITKLGRSSADHIESVRERGLWIAAAEMEVVLLAHSLGPMMKLLLKLSRKKHSGQGLV
jgi:hypothetical protein